jgi:SpoIID/LytB domain protein
VGRAALVALISASVLLASAPEALAARRVVISGGGWGHGVGLSQWGAYGRARRGLGAKRIIKHYYKGVRVARTKVPGKVRVGLLQGRSSISFRSRAARSGGGEIVFKVKGARRPVARGGPSTSFEARPASHGAVKLYKNGRRVRRGGRRSFGGRRRPLQVLYANHGSLVRVVQKDNLYAHGWMALDSYGSGCSGGCLRLVTVVPIQKYLFGVDEVPASWPLEALKVQAVLARTYATYRVRTSGHHRPVCDCSVYDSTTDQVYNGYDRRLSAGSYYGKWKRAVKITKSKAVLYRGAPILSVYHSSSGGHTENNENVWGGLPVPYLRGVRDRPDNVSANPNHNWRVRMSRRSLSRKLDASFNTGRLRRLRIVKPRGVSGRVTVVKSATRGGARVVGSRRTVRVSGSQLRLALELRDTLFRFRFRN